MKSARASLALREKLANAKTPAVLPCVLYNTDSEQTRRKASNDRIVLDEGDTTLEERFHHQPSVPTSRGAERSGKQPNSQRNERIRQFRFQAKHINQLQRMEDINPEKNASNEEVSIEPDSPPSAASNPQEDDAILETPLLGPSQDPATGAAAASAAALAPGQPRLGVRSVRSRKTGKSPQRKNRGVRFHRTKRAGGWGCLFRRLCCFAQNKVVRCMNLTARVVLWSTIIALSVGVIWYSYELFHNG